MIMDCNWLLQKAMIGKDEITIRDLYIFADKIESRCKTDIYFDVSPANIAIACHNCPFPVDFDNLKIIRKYKYHKYELFQKPLHNLAKYAEQYGWFLNRIEGTKENKQKYEDKPKEHFRYLYQEYLGCSGLPIKIFWSDTEYDAGFVIYCDDDKEDTNPIHIDTMKEDDVKLFIQSFGEQV